MKPGWRPKARGRQGLGGLSIAVPAWLTVAAWVAAAEVVVEPVAAVAAPEVAQAAPDLGGLVLVTTRPATELPPVVEAPEAPKGKRRREVVREVAEEAPVALVQVQTQRQDS